MKLLAVVDLGSNTFHLLIVKVRIEGGFETIFRKRIFTGLSDGGVEIIKENKMKSGLEALKDFQSVIALYGVDELKVIGTAVLRKAINRCEFIEHAEKILNTKIAIIDGMMEADYIFKGITLLPDLRIGTHLIMDVGGGSTEFILIKEGKKIWSNSYSLGVGILHAMFHKTEPISPKDLNDLTNFVVKEVQELTKILHGVSLDSLTGASGSFEILQLMTGKEVNETNITKITIETFDEIYNKLIYSDYNQRSKMKGLPAERVKLIVVGMVLKKTIIDLIRPTRIIISPYALKEGVLREMAFLNS